MALRSLFRRHTTEQELDEELKFHLAEMEASGGSVQQAGLEQVKTPAVTCARCDPWKTSSKISGSGRAACTRTPALR